MMKTKLERFLAAGVLFEIDCRFNERKDAMKNILIVEGDLGFIFWLGGALVAADYQPWPACSVSDATELIEKAALPIDLLIVDPSLPGVSKLIAILRNKRSLR